MRWCELCVPVARRLLTEKCHMGWRRITGNHHRELWLGLDGVGTREPLIVLEQDVVR